jgi:hypothetical protein
LKAAKALLDDYNEMSIQISRNFQKSGGLPGRDEIQKVVLLEKERHADIEKLLTPEELVEFELRSSPDSDRLRRDTRDFLPSEAEFRALFLLYQSAGTAMQAAWEKASYAELDEATQRRMRDALAEQAKTVLSPERYTEYMQSMDEGSAKLNRIVRRLDLPLTVAADVVSIQKDISSRALELRENQQLSPSDRQAQVAALVQESKTKISTVIGARGFAAYQNNGYEAWLREWEGAKR